MTLKKAYTKPEALRRENLAAVSALNCSGPVIDKGCPPPAVEGV